MEIIMKKINFPRVITSLFIPLLLASCAATSITGTWKEESYTQPIKNILIIGLSKKETNRRIFEDTLSNDIIKAGKKAARSVKYIDDIKGINKESLKPIIKRGNFDTILIGRVVSIDKESRYIASDVYPSNYNSLYGYYGHVSPYYNQGYIVQDTIVSLEFNIYETKNEKLVWALTTETFEPGNINKEIKKISEIIVKELQKQKLL